MGGVTLLSIMYTIGSYNLYFGKYERVVKEENNFYIPLQMEKNFLLNRNALLEALGINTQKNNAKF